MSRYYRTAASSSNSPYFWSSAIATVPIVVWARDCLFSTCRVHGSSMEPTLRDGDVLLIRKSDFGIIPETLWNIIFDVSGNHDDQSKDRARLIRYESLHGIGNEQHARVYSNPPVALNGQVVVYKDPDAGIPSKLCVKRLVGVGGQLVRPKAWPGKLQQVPPYSLYVEGDNKANSRDSRQIGPISKGLLVGVAEYVLWPPTRMGQIQTTTELDDKGRPRASWL